MTVKELKALLDDLYDDSDVYFFNSQESEGDQNYPVRSAAQKEVNGFDACVLED